MRFLVFISILFVGLNLNANERLLVKTYPRSSENSLNHFIYSQGWTLKKHIKEIDLYIIESDAYKKQVAIEKLNSHPDVKYVEEDVTVKINLGNKPYDETNLLWGLKEIKAKKAWVVSKGSKNIVLAISDTGVWIPHHDLEQNLWKNPGETGIDANGEDKSTNGRDDDQNGYTDDVLGWNFSTEHNHPTDTHYHGTHVAGTMSGIGGNNFGIVGVSWKSSIMSLPFIDRDGSGKISDAIETIIYAANNGAKAVNCSWGTDSYVHALYDAIEYAKSKNTLIVASAGNSGISTDKYEHYPSGYENENIIAVGATASVDRKAGFSNYGPKTIDIAAPGERIYSANNPMYSQSNITPFRELSGTSMAAPHVTGAIGLLYAINPHFNWKQVKKIILDSARPIFSWEGKSVTGGILDLEEASKLALKMSEPK